MTEILGIGLKILSWAWNHKSWALCIVLGAALLWSRHSLSTVTIERDAAQSQIEAEQGKTANANHERDIWKASYEGAAVALKDVRGKLDALDAKAQRQQQAADRAISDLTLKRDTAMADAAVYKTQLEAKAREPGATAASVGRAALERLGR